MEALMSKQRNPNGIGNYRKKADGRFEWRQTIDGKTRYITANTPSELQDKVKKMADIPVITSKLKVDEWFEKWLEKYVKPLKEPATYEQYRLLYKTHASPEIGPRKINTIKTYDIRGIIAKMNEKGLSTWTMKHVRKVLSIGFNQALEDKIIPESPVKKIEIPTKQQKPKKTLSSQELSLIFKEMANSRWIWSIKFMLVTGLRRGELLALTWKDIDWNNKRINIDKQFSKSGMGQTKSAKQRFVPLSEKSVEYLEGQKKMLENEFNQNKELIFPSSDHIAMPPGSYYTMLSRFAKKAGIKASPHCLRHTFVYMTRNVLTLKDMQAILGHSESTQTLDIYGDIINDNTAENASVIDAAFNLAEQKFQEKNLAKVVPLRRIK
jgi:integrase